MKRVKVEVKGIKAYPGVALTAVAIVVVILFGIMGSFLLYISSSGGLSAAGFLNGHKAYYIANAGIEYALSELFASDTITNETFTYDDGTFTKTLTNVNDTIFILTLEGNVGKYNRILTMHYSMGGGAGGSGGGGGASIYVEEEIVVHTTSLTFSGSNLSGPNSTAIFEEGLVTSDLNGGSSIAVSTLYFDGDVYLDGGNASLGNASYPDAIYVNGDLTLWGGSRNVYGDVYVAGDFALKDARIHGDVYVDGNVTLGWTPWLSDDTRIYYTGSISHPNYYSSSILNKCIHVDSVPGFTIPDVAIPQLREPSWYTDNGYVSSGALTSNMKIFAPSYSSTSWRPAVSNAVIVASEGDITITSLWSGFSGVLFAPFGKVTYGGGTFTGIVISRDGFFVTSGGTTANRATLDIFFSGPSEYPFLTGEGESGFNIIQVSE
jgi:hypothetical protein